MDTSLWNSMQVIHVTRNDFRYVDVLLDLGLLLTNVSVCVGTTFTHGQQSIHD